MTLTLYYLMTLKDCDIKCHDLRVYFNSCSLIKSNCVLTSRINTESVGKTTINTFLLIIVLRFSSTEVGRQTHFMFILDNSSERCIQV